MNDQELLRYSRQILLPQISIKGQQSLKDSTLLLIGMGGLGSPSALYLASAGIGHLIIADSDKVELSNLQRQIIHFTDDIGRTKVNSAKDKILAINPNIKVTTIGKLSQDNLNDWVAKVDVVLDGTDNFDIRFKINKACVMQRTPLVSAAVIRFEGQLSVFQGYNQTKPCYQCLYSIEGNSDENCTRNGILSPVTGIIGSLQALQAIKVLLNLGEQLVGKLMLIDTLNLSFKKIKINKDESCKICSHGV